MKTLDYFVWLWINRAFKTAHAIMDQVQFTATEQAAVVSAATDATKQYSKP